MTCATVNFLEFGHVQILEFGQAAPAWSNPPSQKSHQGMEISLERKKFLMSRSYEKV